MIPIKLYKETIFFLAYIKMDQENITFSRNQDKSYTMTDLHILSNSISFGYEDSYNYYNIDVDKTLLIKKSDNEYFVRYNDVNKKKIVPLKLEINNFSISELDVFADDIAEVVIESNDEEFFIKCREIWNKVTELIDIDIDNPRNFVEYYFDENGDNTEDEFIILNVEKNTSAIWDKNRNDLVSVFTGVINNSLQASLVQYRY